MWGKSEGREGEREGWERREGEGWGSPKEKEGIGEEEVSTECTRFGTEQ